MTTSRNYSLVDAPAAIVELADVKAYLNVAHDDDDVLIQRLIDTAVATLDGPEGALGRCLGEQSWRLALDCFPTGGLKIGLPPLVSVDAIKYVNRSGDEVTFPAEAYRVTGVGKGGLVTPLLGWPSISDLPEAVTVEFTAGYETVPAPLAQIIYGLVYFWYEQRPVGDETDSLTATVPFGFEDVVWNWRADGLY